MVRAGHEPACGGCMRITPLPIFENTQPPFQAKRLGVALLPDRLVLSASPPLGDDWIIFSPPSFLSHSPTKSYKMS